MKLSIAVAIWKCGSSWARHLFFQLKEGFNFISLARGEKKRVAVVYMMSASGKMQPSVL